MPGIEPRSSSLAARHYTGLSHQNLGVSGPLRNLRTLFGPKFIHLGRNLDSQFYCQTGKFHKRVRKDRLFVVAPSLLNTCWSKRLSNETNVPYVTRNVFIHLSEQKKEQITSLHDGTG
jgi:hypothetical protein